MLFRNSLKYLFIGISIFSWNAKAHSDSANHSEMIKSGFEAKSSQQNHKHSHFEFKDVVDLFFLADFRFSVSQFVASSAERTFDIWGGAASTSQTISNDVISGFTVANAVSAGLASNEALDCGELVDFVSAWATFAALDIAQTNDPSFDNTVALIASAVAVGKLYDDCLQINDLKLIRRVKNRLDAITGKFSAKLKNGELFQKISSTANNNGEFPLFEILFGLYALARAETNVTASVAHGVADVDSAAAAIIYIDSQLLSEASFLIMDLITITITLIDFIEDHHSHPHHHHDCHHHNHCHSN
jgi:hypothetical protein